MYCRLLSLGQVLAYNWFKWSLRIFRQMDIQTLNLANLNHSINNIKLGAIGRSTLFCLSFFPGSARRLFLIIQTYIFLRTNHYVNIVWAGGTKEKYIQVFDIRWAGHYRRILKLLLTCKMTVHETAAVTNVDHILVHLVIINKVSLFNHM